MGEDAELVETGGFRIDRKRALKKLERYQLPDLQRGVFFWVRAAVAAGAKNYRVRQGAGFLEIRFNGKAFTKSQLADPYGGLFYGNNAQRRNLALGLLSLVRSGALSIEVCSAGQRLSVESIEKDSIEEYAVEKGWTIVRARWGGFLRMFKDTPWKRSAAEYGLRCAMSGLEMNVSGNEIIEDPFFERRVVHEFDWKGARVRMSSWNAPGVHSTVDLSFLGVRVDSTRYKPRFIPSWSLADSPSLAVDASEFKVVKNGDLDALLERIAREEKKLLDQMLEVYGPGVNDSSLRESLLEASWLLLKSPNTDSRNPLLKRLWNSPIVEDLNGKKYSLGEAVRHKNSVLWSFEGRAQRQFRLLMRRAG